MIFHAGHRKMRTFEEVFICNFGIVSRWLSEVIKNGLLTWIVKVTHNEKFIRHAKQIREKTFEKLTDNEHVIEFSNMQSMKDEVKHDYYVSSNILPVRTPIDDNDIVDKTNQTLSDKNDTHYNADIHSLGVNERICLRRSTRVRKPSFYLNYV